MAEYYANDRNFEEAISNYKEALNNEPESAPTLFALAKLYMQVSISLIVGDLKSKINLLNLYREQI